MSDALFDVPNVAAELSLATYIVKKKRNFGPLKTYKCPAHGFHGTHQRHSSTPTLASKDLVKIEPVARPFQRKGYSSKAPPILSSNAYLPRSTIFLGIPKMSTQKAVAECLCQC